MIKEKSAVQELARSIGIRRAFENKMLPHFLSAFLWLLLVAGLALNLNFLVTVTAAAANGGFKGITLFNLWLLLSPAILCPVFYRARKDGLAEKLIVGLSLLAFLFSSVSFSFRFVNDYVLLMKATEVVAWTSFNSIFALSAYRISTGFLRPFFAQFVGSEEETLDSIEKRGK